MIQNQKCEMKPRSAIKNVEPVFGGYRYSKAVTAANGANSPGVAPIGAEGWRQSLLGSRVSRKTMRTIRVGRAVIDEQLISRAHWRDEL